LKCLFSIETLISGTLHTNAFTYHLLYKQFTCDLWKRYTRDNTTIKIRHSLWWSLLFNYL